MSGVADELNWPDMRDYLVQVYEPLIPEDGKGEVSFHLGTNNGTPTVLVGAPPAIVGALVGRGGGVVRAVEALLGCWLARRELGTRMSVMVFPLDSE